MNHKHDHKNGCLYYSVNAGQPFINKSFRGKLLPFLGIFGGVSCYFVMFPTVFLVIVGIFGLSTISTISALNTYMNSIVFQPILIISTIFLIVGLLRFGNLPLGLSIASGIGIFMSMNFYMRSWLFTFSFAILALAYFLAYRKSKSSQLKYALVLIAAVVVLGIVDLGRETFSQSLTPIDTPTKDFTIMDNMRMMR